MLAVIRCSSGRYKLVHFASGVFLRRMVGELAIPKLSKFRLFKPFSRACVSKYFIVTCSVSNIFDVE